MYIYKVALPVQCVRRNAQVLHTGLVSGTYD